MTERPRDLHADDALACTRDARDWRRRWLSDLRQRVFDEGEPYVIADGVAPHEICHAMGVPVVSVPWYSAVISAKRLSATYFDFLEDQGYHAGLPRYVSLPLASTLHGDPDVAPYGGLPKPAFLMARLRGDAGQRVMELWAKALDCPLYVIDASSPEALDPRWWERGQTDWETLYGTERLDFQVAQLEGLVTFAEARLGRRFDRDVFARQMQRVNELGEAADAAKRVLAAAPKLPVSVPEQLQNIMTPTWFRGDQWATDHVRRYRDEVQAHAQAGGAVCDDENIRLLWLNNGLWHDTQFYRAFEESHGAVFVWTMYTNFLSDGYRKYGDDPMRALAARHISMNEQLHTNPWMADWILQMAEDFRADGAVMLTPVGDRLQAYGTRGTINRCEAAGLPVVELKASMVDARGWDGAAARARVAEFIETRVAPGAARRRARESGAG
ncbi:2-hydroxyacyl-CoA dehydratase family protein [Psychromarinibacter sp. C21-152]|uniref:2-hydroxyacyl-CoA dehydratase family protein n=1 Tax=Psychromarinibacter sediminicola TaxID=3033385 RepID=A0AAE3NN34_9RHOB|nr:2-hydroxyacyl-CoA dehydratase family protein [Psychromarinibacter sediminicola]MDF0599301.1 2-hydroxyacyl-CoA dehydratase family protein [Psychromarinibacter sediminicola]